MKPAMKRIVILIASLSALSVLTIAFVMVFRDLHGLSEAVDKLDERIGLAVESQRRDAELLSRRLDALDRRVGEEASAGRMGVKSELRKFDAKVSESLSSVQGRLDTMSEKLDQPPSESAPAAGAERASLLHELDLGLRKQELEADALFEEGRYAEAAGKFSTVVESQPANMDARLKRAVSQYRANPGDTFAYPRIEGDLRSSMENRGEDPMGLEVLALIAIERRAWPEASAYFRRLVAMAPRDASYLKEAGQCSMYEGDLEAAKAYSEEALLLSPRDEEAKALAARVRDASQPGGNN
jgi:tetratricopeptide (TPR) repeat protein